MGTTLYRTGLNRTLRIFGDKVNPDRKDQEQPMGIRQGRINLIARVPQDTMSEGASEIS